MKYDIFDMDLWKNLIIPLVTFLLGFLVSRFTMTMKESKEYRDKMQENSNRHQSAITERYTEYVEALRAYAAKINAGTDAGLDDFSNVTRTGERYFSEMHALCNSILSDNVDKESIKNTHIPLVKEAVEKSIPAHYETMKKIANGGNIPYAGELRRENYKSIYKVYEKYVSQEITSDTVTETPGKKEREVPENVHYS